MSDKIIFLHLPKCGGTTFHTILNRMYPAEEIFDIEVVDNLKLSTEDFVSLTREEKSRLKLLKGHMIFGLHEYFVEPSKYITFLRDPVERIISFYYYVKRRPNHRLYKLNKFSDDMSLYDFVTQVNEIDVNNGQAGLISGIFENEQLMLEKALENIDKRFSFVGTLDRFDESLVVLQNMYGWSTPYYRVGNKTANRPRIDDFDQRTIDAIKHFNAVDIALYRDMKSRLESRLSSEPNLNQKLFWLRSACNTYSFKSNAKQKAGQLMPEVCKKVIRRIIS